MGTVTQVVDSEGKPSRSKEGSYIFTKDGVYFSLSDQNLIEMRQLITPQLNEKELRSQFESDFIANHGSTLINLLRTDDTGQYYFMETRRSWEYFKKGCGYDG